MFKNSGNKQASKPQLKYLLLAGLFLSTFLTSLVPFGSAQAAYVDLDADKRARSYGYYRALDHCVQKLNTGISANSDYDGEKTDPMNGYWFGQGGSDPSGGNPVDVVPYKTGSEGGRTGCADAVRTALKTYWDISYTDFLKGIGYSWDSGLGQWVYSDSKGSRPSQLKTLLENRGIDTSWNDAIAYRIYAINFGKCSATDVPDSTTNKGFADSSKEKDNLHYTWMYNIGTDGPVKTVYTYKTSTAGTSGTDTKHTLYQGNEKSCSEIANLLGQKKFADAYYDSLLVDKCKAAGVATVGRSADGTRSACVDGAKHVGDADYCRKYTNASYIEACKKGQGVVLSSTDIPEENVGTGTDAEEGEANSACQVEGIGWILCPVINAMAGLSDGLFGLVATFMNVKPLGLSSDTPLYAAWAIMRNIANVAFVIAFLIIIFSQLTGTGISNYGVKKMLPRLVIAAVLVNISYYLCAIAVDISNILGSSLQQVLSNVANDVGGEELDTTLAWSNIATSVLSLGTIGTGAVIATAALSSVSIWAMLSGLLPLLVGALFALIIAFLVLLARQAFIIILIVISPLAFVAFLLPNTENLFNKWRSFFVTLLALFPMMALVFGGSVLASAIMRQGSTELMASGDGGQSITGFFLYVGSVAILAIPFFVTPLLIKLSGGVLNRFAGFINNPHKGPFDKLGKAAERIRDNTRGNSYANKLNANKKISGFGARWRTRRGLKDQAVKTGVDAAEAGLVFTNDRAEALSKRASENQLATSAANSAQSAQITDSLAKGDNAGVIAALGAAGENPEVAKALSAQTAKAVAESIKDIKISSNIKPGDLGEMGRQFREAVRSGDSVKARAMQDMMLTSGGPGIKAWRENVSQLESTDSINPSMREKLQDRVLNEQPGIKAQDASVMSWATDANRTLDAIRADAKTWGVSNNEFAGMKAFAQTDAINAGVITKDRAVEIIASEAYGGMDEGVKVQIREIAGSSNASPFLDSTGQPFNRS